MYRDRNEVAQRRSGIERELVSLVDQRVLRLFRHVVRLEEYPKGWESVGVGCKWRTFAGLTDVRLDV